MLMLITMTASAEKGHEPPLHREPDHSRHVEQDRHRKEEDRNPPAKRRFQNIEQWQLFYIHSTFSCDSPMIEAHRFPSQGEHILSDENSLSFYAEVFFYDIHVEDDNMDDDLRSLVICVVKDSWVGVSSRAMALEIIRKYHGRSETMAQGIRKL